MFDHIFKEFPSWSDRVQDNYTLILGITGNILIAISFMFIGVLCLVYAGKPQNPPKSKQGVTMTKLFGYFLICCALSRTIDVICVWYNYANLSGYARVLTGVIAFLTILLIPRIVKETYGTVDNAELNRKLDETKERMDKIEDLTKKLDNGPNNDRH